MTSQNLPVVPCADGQPTVELRFVGGPQDGLVMPASFEAWGEPGMLDWQFGVPGGDVSHRYLSLDDYEPGVTASLTLEYIGTRRGVSNHA